MMIVRIYYAPYCPHCRDLINLIEREVEAMKAGGVFTDPSWFYDGETESKVFTGITVVPVQVSRDFEATSNDLPSARYVRSDWLKKHGKTELQKKLAEKGQLVDMLSGGAYPVVEIEYHEGSRLKQIVITGGAHGKDAKKYAKNLAKLILTLCEVEKRSMMDEMKVPFVYEVR